MEMKTPAEDEFVSINGIQFFHGQMFAVIDDFYTRIQQDPLLQVPFRSVHDWPEHIQRLTHFWWVRFGGEPYQFNMYNPVAKHYFAGFNRELLSRWLMIFHSTLQDHLSSEQTRLWSLIAQRMGEALAMKNEIFARENE